MGHIVKLLNVLSTGPGLHHRFLQWMIEFASGHTPDSTSHPFTQAGTSHNKDNIYWSDKFAYKILADVDKTEMSELQGQPALGVDTETCFDVLYLERIAYNRESSKNNDLTKAENFPTWQEWNSNYVEQIRNDYNIDHKENIPKFILRDSLKHGFLDFTKVGLYLEVKNMIKKMKSFTDNYLLINVDCFYAEDNFLKATKIMDDKFKLKLNFYKVQKAYKMMRDRNPILQNHLEVNDILLSIKNKQNIILPELDVLQEAYLYAKLEEENDYVIMPLVNNFFQNTKDILEYITYYPKHYKAMNPNLPTFNGIPNPFYLANLKK